MSADQVNPDFPNGLIVKRKPGAKDFVVCEMSIKVGEFKKWLDENQKSSGWVNLNVLRSKEDQSKIYAIADRWEPDVSKSKAITEEKIPAQGGYDKLPF
jgi:hypothetical protein